MPLPVMMIPSGNISFRLTLLHTKGNLTFNHTSDNKEHHG
ncbi:hypothetical protein UUU_36560 (plasmid) [Klebsiella pneumoniae subsp. pneumoniae DSM 30104 = JCM 1662 = NBRC 14940]|nr:hypothetical protein UUU_36560 [Klebsiella pneumoniae subsp. pneumoniae DSM 30104 = JCM 1662 = NBRC 14940]